VKLLGCVLLAGAGVWSGVLAAQRVSDNASRCGTWCRMMELTAFELERFRTPLPDLFASLALRLDGIPQRFCEAVSSELAAKSADLRSVWQMAADNLPAPEREILLPLGEVLGRFGAEEQVAALESAKEQMNCLWQTRQSGLLDRRKVCFGVLSAGGMLLAILLM